MQMRVDQRTIRFERDDEALAEVEARREGWLDQELGLARLFCRIDLKAAYVPASCGSVKELASRRGYDATRAQDLCLLGYALEAEPELEVLLRANEIGFAAALALGRVYQDPLFLEPEDEWVRWARFERLTDLKRRIRRRVESVRQGRRADVAWSAHVTARTAENLARCRQVASQKAGLLLTNGQLLDVVSTAYLLENDELEQEERARRLPPTQERPYERTIPAEVARALEERSGGLCEFGSCERLALETCHLVAHREGSGREVEDLVRGCRLHHKLFDAGRIRFLAFTRSDDPFGAGLPVFLALETNELLQPKPRPKPGSTAVTEEEQPEWLLRALGTRLRRRLARLLGQRQDRLLEKSPEPCPPPHRASRRASERSPERLPAKAPKPAPNQTPNQASRPRPASRRASERAPPSAQGP